jgi:hypothetical protein
LISKANLLEVDEIGAYYGQIWMINSPVGSTITNCNFVNLIGSESVIMTVINSNITIQAEIESNEAGVAVETYGFKQS